MTNELTAQQAKCSEAILTWLNILHIQEKSIASLSELRDGVIFGKLLYKVYVS